MINIIDLIGIKGEIKKEGMFNFFKSNTAEINSEIYKIIQRSSKITDFCDYCSNKNNNFGLINILQIIESYFSKNCSDKSFSSFESKMDEYIFCISQLFLSIEFFLKVEDIINKMLICSKKKLYKLSEKNKIQNCNQYNLFSLIDNLLLFSKTKNNKLFPNVSAILNTSFSTEKMNNNLLFKFSNTSKIKNKNSKNISSLLNETFTPRFNSISDESEENIQKQEQDTEFPIRNDSSLTLSEFVFANEPITPHPVLPKKGLYNLKTENFHLNPRRKPNSIKLNSFKEINRENKKHVSLNISDENYCRNLLEMINNLYKDSLVNIEEKLKLKRLVLNNSDNIKYFFNNVYNNSRIPGEVFMSELKNMIR